MDATCKIQTNDKAIWCLHFYFRFIYRHLSPPEEVVVADLRRSFSLSLLSPLISWFSGLTLQARGGFSLVAHWSRLFLPRLSNIPIHTPGSPFQPLFKKLLTVTIINIWGGKRLCLDGTNYFKIGGGVITTKVQAARAIDTKYRQVSAGKQRRNHDLCSVRVLRRMQSRCACRTINLLLFNRCYRCARKEQITAHRWIQKQCRRFGMITHSEVKVNWKCSLHLQLRVNVRVLLHQALVFTIEKYLTFHLRTLSQLHFRWVWGEGTKWNAY